MAFFGLFVLYPMIRSIFVSFYSTNLREYEFIGLGNYKILFMDPVFHRSLLNTFYFVVGVVPTTLIIAMLISIVIYPKKEFILSFYRGVFYIPVVSSAVSIILLWRWVLNPSRGIAN